MNFDKKHWKETLTEMEQTALKEAQQKGSGRAYTWDGNGNQIMCNVKVNTKFKKGHAQYWEINSRRVARISILKRLAVLHEIGARNLQEMRMRDTIK